MDLVTDIYPLGNQMSLDSTMTLREHIRAAPFFWYPNQFGIDPNNADQVRTFHTEHLLRDFPEADQCRKYASVPELAVMRLPKGVHLHILIDGENQSHGSMADLRRQLKRCGWRLATLWEAPLFVRNNQGKVHLDEMKPAIRHLWCLGSPLPKVEAEETRRTVRISMFHKMIVPSQTFPLLSWGRSRSFDGSKSSGWSIERQLTHWTRVIACDHGVPLLLVR